MAFSLELDFFLILFCYNLYLSGEHCLVNWGCRICQLHLCRGVRPLLFLKGPPISFWCQPVILGDGILVDEQCLT